MNIYINNKYDDDKTRRSDNNNNDSCDGNKIIAMIKKTLSLRLLKPTVTSENASC